MSTSNEVTPTENSKFEIPLNCSPKELKYKLFKLSGRTGKWNLGQIWARKRDLYSPSLMPFRNRIKRLRINPSSFGINSSRNKVLLAIKGAYLNIT